VKWKNLSRRRRIRRIQEMMMRLGIELKLLEEDVLRIETTVHQVI
jgi:hypothetical protein